MAHFSVWQRSPFRKSFIPSRRHSRQTGPIYRAKSNLPFFRGQGPGASDPVGAVYGNFRLRPAYFGSGMPDPYKTTPGASLAAGIRCAESAYDPEIGRG